MMHDNVNLWVKAKGPVSSLQCRHIPVRTRSEAHNGSHVFGVYSRVRDTYTVIDVYICTVPEFFEYNKERGCNIRICYK